MNRTVSRYPILYRPTLSGALSWMSYRAASRLRNAFRSRRAPRLAPRAAESQPARAKHLRVQEARVMSWQSAALAAG